MMKPYEIVAVAATALGRAKTRSLLTVLGVVIGVGAVIAMVSVGEGAKARVAKTFESMGTNMLVISSGSSRTGGVRGGTGSNATLTWDDVDALSRLPSLSVVAPQMRTNAQVVSDSGNWQTSVFGTTPAWFTIRNWQVKSGEPISDADVRTGRKIAVVGTTVVNNLFGEGADPIGETIRINKIPFVVVGVLAPKGNSAMGQDQDDTVIIPSTTMAAKISGGLQKFLRGDIVASAAAADKTQQAQAEIEELLRERHRLGPDEENDFRVRDLSEIAGAQKESAATITSLLAGVALVSLLVGGIGIMNIMLVSVTERTREIGLRMAVGATPREVLSQFLAEAVVLSVAGGLIGIAAGIGAAKYMAARFEFPTLVRPDIVMLAVAVSAIVGIAFGLFPAIKASRLDPITALRHE